MFVREWRKRRTVQRFTKMALRWVSFVKGVWVQIGTGAVNFVHHKDQRRKRQRTKTGDLCIESTHLFTGLYSIKLIKFKEANTKTR